MNGFAAGASSLTEGERGGLRQILPGIGLLHRGVDFGDASLRHPTAAARLRGVARDLGLDDLVYLKAEFTNQVADSAQLGVLHSGADLPPLLSTLSDAEGFLLDRTRRGVVIANGDCCIGVLSGPVARSGVARAVVMHLGLDCLYRADGSPTVLERAIDTLGQPASQLSLWLGASIQACCLGYALQTQRERIRHQALEAEYGTQVLPGRVRQGPRKGAFAMDHQALAIELARRLGVAQVVAERACTACAGLSDPDQPGYGQYYSNTRDQHGGRERNLCLVALVESSTSLGNRA